MIYETIDDRRRQWSIADEYAWALGFECQMTLDSELLPWDAEFSFGSRVVCITEIKVRHCDRLTYATYKIDKVKVDDMLAEAVRRDVRCGVLVEFNDGRFKVPVSGGWLAAHATTSVLQRKDRDGEQPDPAWEWSNHLWQPLTSTGVGRT